MGIFENNSERKLEQLSHVPKQIEVVRDRLIALPDVRDHARRIESGRGRDGVTHDEDIRDAGLDPAVLEDTDHGARDAVPRYQLPDNLTK